MKQIIFFFAICLIVTLSAFAGDKDKYPHMTIAELVKAAPEMAGKKAVVSGCYVNGFEWNLLLSCEDSGVRSKPVWVVVSPEFEGRKQLKDTGTRYCRVEVLGTLATGSTYGHENGFRYQLTVYRVYSIGPKEKFKKHSD